MSNGSNVKAANKKAIEKVVTSEEREEQVRLSAYYSWQSKGEKHGEDVADWLEAEDSL